MSEGISRVVFKRTKGLPIVGRGQVKEDEQEIQKILRYKWVVWQPSSKCQGHVEHMEHVGQKRVDGGMEACKMSFRL